MKKGNGIGLETYYVAPEGDDKNPGTGMKPFATLEKASNTIRKLIKKGLKKNIEVILRDGTYYLNKTFVLGLQDSAPKGITITYKAQKGEEPIISSGRKAMKWKKLEKPPAALPKKAKGKIWVANIPETKEGKWRFYTLYDGEEMLPRARSKGFIPPEMFGTREERWKNLDRFLIPDGLFRNWNNSEDVELVIRPYHVWLVNYLPIKSIDLKNKVVKTTIPATYKMTRMRPKHIDDETCWIENAIDFLDEPGKWVLNTREGKLYFWPKNGKPGDNITIPQCRELVKIEGKNVDTLKGDIPVRGIRFAGIIFTCGDRDEWTKKEKGLQHDWDMFDKDNALLRFRGAADCAVENCTFRNSGGGGIRVDLYSQNIRIKENHIHHIGGTGILLCGYGPGKKDVNKNHEVIENHIHNNAQIYWHAPGIFIWQSGENRIAKNYLHDLPYDAVVLSGVRPRFFDVTDPVKWTEKGVIPKNLRENMRVIRWAEVGKPATVKQVEKFAHARNNIIEYNEIHNVMEMLGDGNAIYYSCAGENNIVRYNLIYRTLRTECEIRFDDDQYNSIVFGNIVFGHGIRLKHINTIQNNIIVGHDAKIHFNPSTEKGSVVKHNIVYSTRHDGKLYKTRLGFELDWIKRAAPDFNLFFAKNKKKGKDFFRLLQDNGMDKNSRFGDPQFIDLEKGDVRLNRNSPALEMGIESIDVRKIGLTMDPAFKRLRAMGFEKFYGETLNAEDVDDL